MEITKVKSFQDLFKVKGVKVLLNTVKKDKVIYDANALYEEYEGDPLPSSASVTVKYNNLKAHITLSEQPATCANIFVSNFSYSSTDALPVMQALIKSVPEISASFGYTNIFATHIEGNLICDMLEKTGFVKQRAYVNKRTNSMLIDYMYSL